MELQSIKEQLKSIKKNFNLLSLTNGHPGQNIYYLGHHKCATNWMRAFLLQIAKNISYKYEVAWPNTTKEKLISLRPYTIYLYVNARQKNLVDIPENSLGFHLIRDPRDAIVSTYFSDRNSHINENRRLLESRDFLLKHTLEEGLMYLIEQERIPYLNQIEKLNLDTYPNILEIKYETLVEDEYTEFSRILEHLKINIPTNKLNEIIQNCSFKFMSKGRKRGQENQNSHFRKGIGGDWVNYMTKDSDIYQIFQQRYGYLLSRLGYDE